MRPRYDRQSAGCVATTLALSAGGGFVAHALGLPGAWIGGGLLAVAIASLAGLHTEVPQPLRPPVYLVLGVYAGSGVTRDTLQQMQTWPLSFLILALSVAALIAVSYAWLHGRCGWDRNAALLASLPGALSFVMAAAEGLRADLRKVAISQSLRLLLLVELIPLVAILLGHAQEMPAGARLPPAGPLDLLILFAAATAVSYLLERNGLAGGWVLGGLATTAALRLAGAVEAGLPDPLVIVCTVALAAIAGSRFRPGDHLLLKSLLGASLGAFALALAVSVVAAGAVSLLLDVNFIQTLIAFAPGAMDALIVLANAMNVDPAYIAAHHLVRFLAIALAVPFLARWLQRNP